MNSTEIIAVVWFPVGFVVIPKVTAASEAVKKAQAAQFDEKLSIISMMMESIGALAKEIVIEHNALQHVVKYLRKVKKKLNGSDSVYELCTAEIDSIRDEMDKLKHANALSSQTKTIMQREIRLLEAYKKKVETEDAFSKDNKEQFKIVKAAFTTNVNALGNKQKK